jgi:hypothetical protein
MEDRLLYRVPEVAVILNISRFQNNALARRPIRPCRRRNPYVSCWCYCDPS